MGRIYGNGFLHLNTPLYLFLWIRVDSRGYASAMICLAKVRIRIIPEYCAFVANAGRNGHQDN